MYNFTVCPLEISDIFGAALSNDSLPWSGDGACATCSASNGRTATPYSPSSTISWIGVCAEEDDEDPILSASLQMIWRQTACSTIALDIVTNLKDDLDLEEFVFCAANEHAAAATRRLRPPNFWRPSSLMRALHVLKRTRRLLMD